MEEEDKRRGQPERTIKSKQGERRTAEEGRTYRAMQRKVGSTSRGTTDGRGGGETFRGSRREGIIKAEEKRRKGGGGGRKYRDKKRGVKGRQGRPEARRKNGVGGKGGHNGGERVEIGVKNGRRGTDPKKQGSMTVKKGPPKGNEGKCKRTEQTKCKARKGKGKEKAQRKRRNVGWEKKESKNQIRERDKKAKRQESQDT